jgi:predicted patatin/cPLA2 family phospholipase
MNLSHLEPTRSALVVEGGAMRSIFSAGLLDGFLKNDFNPFDFYIGVSAGAYNLATYLSKQAGLSLRIFCKIASEKQFISYRRFLQGGHLLDLDWLTQTVPTEYELDLHKVLHPDKPFYICVTEVETGEAVYIKPTTGNFTQALKATMALPLLYRRFPIVNGHAMTDGGVADGIPVAEAIRLGAKRILVIRSRHRQYQKRDTLWHKYIRSKLKDYPALTVTMRERVQRFEITKKLMRQPPEGVKILEVCPPEKFQMSRFGRSQQRLLQGYDAGYHLAEETIQLWHAL